MNQHRTCFEIPHTLTLFLLHIHTLFHKEKLKIWFGLKPVLTARQLG